MTSTSERIARLSPQKLALLKKAMGDSAGIAEPIAVVGMGCRFAGASSVQEYWRLIRDGLDMTGEIPASRWDVDAFYDPSGTIPGKMTTRWGGFVDGIDRFDAAFFGISPREAEKMDPQHRLLLEVVWESLEYGGIAPSQLRESSTGVFVGVGGVDYSRIPVQLDNYYEQITAYSGTGNALSIAANRISYTLDLRGPSLAIDTACSSSLVATHLAIRSLRSNECDAAIVGGVNAILTPETTLAFSQAHMLSPDGKCRPFDDRANGYVRGEGCGVVVLKRLSDAVSSGDLILATIRGSAINQDGLTSGITAPRGTAQIDVILQALRDARCDPDDVSYVEAHGTATPLGDPIEVNSLAEVFRRPDSGQATPCYIGSVKANIGHTETAAGMASLIKTVLMLRNRTIPKQTHFQQLNPHIDLGESRLRIAQEITPWVVSSERVAPEGTDAPGGTLLAGVSSFGFGGANAHLVLEAAANVPITAARLPVAATQADRSKHILTLSAKSREQLRDLAIRFQESIDQKDGYPLADACFTSAVGRSHFKYRLAIPARDPVELSDALSSFAAGTESKQIKQGRARRERRLSVAFLFPGQGAQYPGMGRQLFASHPIFRQAIEHCDEILADHLPRRLLDVLMEADSDQPLLNQTQYTQPALFAIEYALSRLWRSFGIEPSVMIGHSIGDYVAACEAGVFSLADGLKLIAHRARLVQALPRDGMMAVVFADREQVADLVMPYAQDVAIAAHNGPQNVVIAGRTEVVSKLLEQFKLAGVESRALEVSHAMHSPLLEPILDEFEQRAGEVTYHSPKIPLISSRDGRLLDDRVRDPKYWRDHLRNTVRFVDGVETLQSFSLDAAIEMGPGTTLCGLSSRLWRGEPIAWLPSLRGRRDDWDVLTETLSELYVLGGNIDWASFDRPWSRRRTVLPTYPFEARRFWYDMSRRRSHPVRPRLAVHPLLGNRLPLAGDKTIYELILDARHPSFLIDHQIDQIAVVPAAAYMEQALAVAKIVFGDGNHVLGSLSLQQALVLAEDQSRLVQVQVGPDLRGERTFEVHSRPASAEENDDDSAWTLHASGTLHRHSADESPVARIDRSEIESRLSHSISGQRFYQTIAGCGLQYGPKFQVLAQLKTGAGECLARLELPQSLREELADYALHPAVLDGCLQSMAGVIADPEADTISDLLLPTYAERLRVFRTVDSSTLWIHTRLRNAQADMGTFDADIDLLDEAGEKVAEIVGARVQRVAKQRHSREKRPSDLLYELGWESKPIGSSSATGDARSPDRSPGRWLLFADSTGLADRVAEQLSVIGDQVSLVHAGHGFGILERDQAGGSKTYQVDPLKLSDYEELVSALASHSAKEIRVVDFRGVDFRGSVPADDATEADSASELCGQALTMLQAFAKCTKFKVDRIVMVTRGANAVLDGDSVSPAQSSLWGLGRTAMVEMHHLSLRMVDLDPAEQPASSTEAMIEQLLREEAGDHEPDDHVAYRGGQRYAAHLRAVPERLEQAPNDSRRSIPASGRFSLRAGTSGSVDGLHYVPIGKRDLEPNEVEVEVKSTGLNFSDVLKALGLYPGVKDEIVPLGIECAGVVSRVGKAVDRFRPGQRVMGVAPYSFASHAVTAEYAIVETPNNLSDDQAATIPITFLTAQHALCNLARLAEGERVLIHAGAGGVGQAAIQIAQSIGAEVFATAGNDRKRDFLRSLGVQHVLDSRSLAFAEQILEITSGEGVDVVLNSLPGEAITKSLSILAAYGRFLEIGKTDIYQNRRIGLWPFQDNLSYFAIDLDRMLRQRPDEIRQLYRDLMPRFEQGTYRPLPLQTFSPNRVIDAFRYMAQRKNIGKVVVSLADRELEAEKSGDSESPFGCEGTVLITGGLGALGYQVAQQAISQGATHLAILTRRDPNDIQDQCAQLQSSGVPVAVIQGDVCDPGSLADALKTIPSSFPPIRGVIHAAGVLRDGLMQTMSLDQLKRAMAPKTLGAWNLHRLLQGPLDFFVMFSSVASTIGSPGQANYAAGNAFMDGLAQHRRGLGLPATSIAWGPWGTDGMAASEEVQRQLSDRGMRRLAPEVALSILDQTMRSRPTNLTVMDVDWEKLVAKLPGRGSTLLSAFRPDESSTSGRQIQPARDEQLRKRLESASPQTRRDKLQRIIASALGEVMGIDAGTIELDQPLATLGLDSLMGMELRSNLESNLGIEIPVASLFDEPTVASLAKVAGDSFTSEQQTASADSKATDSKATDSKATDSKASDSKASDSKASDSKASDSKASDSKAPSSKAQAKVPANSIVEPIRRRDLVALGGSAGTESPLFCIHPVGGDLRCYHEFAKAMRGRWVYGLRAPGLQAGSQPHQSIDQMVSDYIGTIREAHPKGPYCLMGWSTGGIFAYEIARRLHQDRIPVQSLVMVDTPLPVVFEKIDLSDDARFLVDLVEFANYFAGTSMEISYDWLHAQSEQVAVAHVLDLAIKNGVLPAKTSQAFLNRLIDVCKQHVRLLQSYQPPPSDLPVHLLRPEDTGILSEATRQSHADDMGWGTLVKLRSDQVPGHHFTMMTGPNAVLLARKIETLLREPALIGLGTQPSGLPDSAERQPLGFRS